MSPIEANRTIGERISRRSKTLPPVPLGDDQTLSPTNRFWTIHSISSRFIRYVPPHQRSNSRKRGGSVSIFEYRL